MPTQISIAKRLARIAKDLDLDSIEMDGIKITRSSRTTAIHKAEDEPEEDVMTDEDFRFAASAVRPIRK